MISQALLNHDVSIGRSRLDRFAPRCRVVCALLAVAVLASVGSVPGLAVGTLLPLVLLCLDGAGRIGFLRGALFDINKIAFFIWIFLPLTYPGERLWGVFSLEGARAALVVTWKLNVISVVMLQMVVSMGVPKISEALGELGFPLKMRTLLILTVRYILLLGERLSTLWRAVRLRGPDVRGTKALGTLACTVGTTLIHSLDRAERSALAIRCRGGISGFSQGSRQRWARDDSLLCAAFLLNALFVAIVHFIVVR